MTAEPDEGTIKEIIKVLLTESRHYVAEIYWAKNAVSAESVLRNGSCFFLNIGNNLFGVTANHVYEAYIQEKQKSPDLVLLIRNLIVPNFENRIIDRDPTTDILTFTVSDSEFKEIEIRPYSCPSNKWPPKPPIKGRGVVMTGFAEVDRKVLDPKNIEFMQVANLLVVTDIDNDKVEVQIEKENLKPVSGEEMPSMTKNLSGNSGAPLWTVSADLHENFRLAGIVFQQFLADGEDGTPVIFARRPEYILEDGKLNRNEHGHCIPRYRE